MPPRRDSFSGRSGLLAAGSAAPPPPPPHRQIQPEDAPPVYPEGQEEEDPFNLENYTLEDVLNMFDSRSCPMLDPIHPEAFW